MANVLRHGVLLVAVVALVLGVPVVIVSPSLAQHFLFFPDRRAPGPPPPVAGVVGEAVTVETDDGLDLLAWWYGAGSGAPGVLFLHGNAGSVAGRPPLVRGLVERGISVLLLEYRGYGGNEGEPTMDGLVLDAAAGLDAVAERVGWEATVLFGRSLGGAMGAQALEAREPAGAILESTFTSLEAVAAAAYPILPSFFFRRLRGHLDTRAVLAGTRVPVLVVHGTRDGIVPLRMGLELYEAAPGPKEWYGVTGAGHNDVFAVGGEEYFRRLSAFVREATGSAEAEEGGGE